MPTRNPADVISRNQLKARNLTDRGWMNGCRKKPGTKVCVDPGSDSGAKKCCSLWLPNYWLHYLLVFLLQHIYHVKNKRERRCGNPDTTCHFTEKWASLLAASTLISACCFHPHKKTSTQPSLRPTTKHSKAHLHILFAPIIGAKP